MAAGNARLRPVDDLLAPAVAETIRNLEVAAEDAGAVRLATRYAAAIDAAAPELAGQVLNDLGPKLLACLEALGATPRARAAAGKGGAQRGPSKLQALREQRA